MKTLSQKPKRWPTASRMQRRHLDRIERGGGLSIVNGRGRAGKQYLIINGGSIYHTMAKALIEKKLLIPVYEELSPGDLQSYTVSAL